MLDADDSDENGDDDDDDVYTLFNDEIDDGWSEVGWYFEKNLETTDLCLSEKCIRICLEESLEEFFLIGYREK